MSQSLEQNQPINPLITEDDRPLLSTRDRQLQAVFETVLDAIAIADDEGRYLDVNPAACKLFDLDRDELLGRSISDFTEHGVDFTQLWQQWRQPETARGEFSLVRADGEIRTVEYAFRANFVPQSHLLVMRDITDGKLAEAQVEELTRQLAQERAQVRSANMEPASPNVPPEYHRLDEIARHIRGVLYQFRMRPDGSFHFPYASEKLREIHAVSPKEVCEDASGVFKAIHPDDIDRIHQSILDSAAHLTPWYCEYRTCLADGRVLWLRGSSTPQRETDGSIIWYGYIRDITDIKTAEADTQRLLAILETTSDFIATADVTGKPIYLNQAWRKFLNHDEEAIASVEISNAHPQWVLDRIFNQVLPETARYGTWRGETFLLDPAGGEIPVSIVVLAHKSKEGTVENFSVIMRDITETKATELALRTSEEKFRSIIENLNDLVYVINPDRTFSYLGPQLKDMTGYEITELLERPFAPWVYPADLTICVNALHRCLQGEKLRGIEYRVLHKDGNYYWHSANLAPLQNHDGLVVSCLGIARNIHAEKQAKIALEVSNTRWELAIEGAGDGTWDWNLKTNEVIFSRQWKAMLGYAEHEITNVLAEWDLLVHPEDKARCYADFAKHFDGETSTYRNEHRLRCKDGSYKWILDRGQLVEWDTEGKPLRFIGTHCDISDRKTAELELEQFFSLAIDLLCIADVSGRFRRLNPAWETILGYSTQELEGQLFLDLVHPDDLASTLDAISNLSQQKPIPQFTNRYRAKDGSYRYIEWRSVPCGDLIYTAARDITERKQAELENRRVQKFLSSVIENIPNMVFVKDAVDLKYVSFNKAGEELIGYPRTALLGKNDYDLFTAAAADSFRSQDRAALASGQVLDIPEERIQTSHQGTRIVHTRKIPILDELGNPKYLLGISEDITDRKQAEDALRASEEKLRSLFDLCPLGIALNDMQGGFIEVNSAAETIYGYTLEELKHLSYLDLTPQKYAAAEIHQLELLNTIGRYGPYQKEYIRKDGSLLPVELLGVLVTGNDGSQYIWSVIIDISDRKQAEMLIQKSQKRYETLAEASPIGVFLTDAKGDCLYVNQTWSQTTGLTQEKALGPNWARTLHPQDRERVFQEWYDSASVKQKFQSEYRFLRPDGSVAWVIGQALPLIDSRGEIEGYVGTVTDISDRKQAEIKLATSQAELTALFNAIQDVIIVLNTEGRYLKIAGGSSTLLYRPSQELLGKTLHEVLPQNLADTFLNGIHQAIITQSVTQLEYSLPLGDRLLWFDARISPMSQERVVWVARDITDRKRQEQALRLIVEGTAAKTGEEFFKSCVQYLAQALEVRYACISEFVNSEKSIATTLAFWAGDDFGENFTYNLCGTPCQNVHRIAEVCRYPNLVQCLFPKDDDLVTLQAESYAGLPIVDATGNRLGLLVVLDTKPMVQDIEMQSAILKIFATRAGAEMERMQAEAALRRSSMQLRLQSEELATTLNKLQQTQSQLIQAEKMSSLGQLVAGIAHEINNPVSFIYGNLQPATDYASELIKVIHLYQKYYPSPPQVISDILQDMDFEYLASDFSKLLESMKTGATRIRDIVKSLRTFSRLDEADFKKIDIHENMDSTLMILQNRLNGRAGKPEINITKNYGALPLIECYGGLLNQVFMNLLMNAIDAIEQRQENLEISAQLDYIGQITITTSLAAENLIYISVQDNGCGMTPEVQEKIFNPFFTTKPIGKGTGMGLANSYQIVTENHRGNLRCISTLGEGTELAIELPICELKPT
ncbi:MAG: PAS domain S-box protein [Microcoleus sp.]